MIDVKKILTNNKPLAFIAVAIIIAIVLMFAVRFDVEEKDIPDELDSSVFKTKKEEQIVWEETGAAPGITKFEEIKNNIPGSYDGRERDGKLTAYSYKNLEKYHDTTRIGVTDSGIIKYVYMTIEPYQKTTSSFYIEKYDLGEPELKKIAKEYGYFEAWVHLSIGVMLYVDPYSDLVYSEMFFEPMSEQEFNTMWGNKNLADEYIPHDYGESM